MSPMMTEKFLFNADTLDIKEMILQSLDEDQAEDIVAIDLNGKADFALYMIIVTGKATRHVASMIDKLMTKLKKVGITSSCSGMEPANWVLLDVGSVVVHAFVKEHRELYNLESLWQ